MQKILVADDEDDLCLLYALDLRSEGYEVVTTSDGAGLIEMIRQHKPDLIVLDIRMGEYNGLDILQDIRKAYYNKPVILCSAYSAFKYDLRSIAADYYVIKSGDLTELKTKIKMVLECTASLTTEKRIRKMGREGNERVPDIVVG